MDFSAGNQSTRKYHSWLLHQLDQSVSNSPPSYALYKGGDGIKNSGQGEGEGETDMNTTPTEESVKPPVRSVAESPPPSSPPMEDAKKISVATTQAVEKAASDVTKSSDANTDDTSSSDTGGTSMNLMRELIRYLGSPLLMVYENVFLLPLYFPELSVLRGLYLFVVLRLLFMMSSWFIYVFVAGKRAKYAYDVIHMWIVVLGLQCMMMQTYPTRRQRSSV